MGLYRKVKEWYGLFVQKKYTTLAGALVFFLILSAVPFSFWVTMLFGKFLVGAEEVFRPELYGEIGEVLSFLRKNAEEASDGATLFLGITSLYSASNFFYHLRRCGEIVYGAPRRRRGWAVRLSALSHVGDRPAVECILGLVSGHGMGLSSFFTLFARRNLHLFSGGGDRISDLFCTQRISVSLSGAVEKTVDRCARYDPFMGDCTDPIFRLYPLRQRPSAVRGDDGGRRDAAVDVLHDCLLRRRGHRQRKRLSGRRGVETVLTASIFFVKKCDKNG